MSANWSLTPASNGLLVQDNPWGSLFRGQSNWELTVTPPIADDDSHLMSVYCNFPSFDTRYVLAYPSMIYGSKFGSTPDTSGGNIPVQLTDCDFHIDFDWYVRHPAGSRNVFNVAIETFFHDSLPITGPGHSSGENNKVFELMVWLDRPEADLYLGRQLGVFEHMGVSYDVMAQGNRSDYVAFIAQDRINSGSLQWKAFVDQTMKYFPTFDPARLHMSAIEMGAEIWTAESLEFFWRKFSVTKTTDDSGPINTDSDTSIPTKKYCMTTEHAHELSVLYHQIAVANNKLALYYESIREGLKSGKGNT